MLLLMEAETPGERLLPLGVTTRGKTLLLRDVLRRQFTCERSIDVEMRDTYVYSSKEVKEEAKTGCVPPWATRALLPC